MAQQATGGSGLTPEMKKILSELGRSQRAYSEYGSAGRFDLQGGAHRYADQLRAQAQGMGFDINPYGTQNQNGMNFESWYTPQSGDATAGNYDASKPGLTPETLGASPPAGGADNGGGATPVDTGKPTTTPLPSSQFNNLNKGGTPIDWNAINNRAARDAHMQVDALAQQANRGFDRFASEGQTQIAGLQKMYAGQYTKNAEATQLSARDALQRSASRGFMASGISADAEQKANLRGEQMRMDLAAQESGQVGDISNRISQAGQERNDTLAGLTAQEQNLMAQLADQYGQRAVDNNFREQSLNTQTALSLLGMDTQFNQFNTGLEWDKNKFGQQLDFSKLQRGDQISQFTQSLNEQVANRMWQQGFSDRQLNTQNQWHTQDHQLGVDTLGAQDKWHTADHQLGVDTLGAQDKWHTADTNFQYSQLGRQDAWHATDAANQAASIAIQRQNSFNDNAFKWVTRKDNLSDKSFAQNQLTAKYMDEADWMMSQLKSGNPDAELNARGIKTADDIVRWYSDRGMKITSEGGNLTELIQYIRQRSGGGYSSQGAGPQAPPKNPFDPYGIYRR